MELIFLALLILLMAIALGSGYPVAFALPGSAILAILIAAAAGYLVAGNVDAYFAQGGPAQWLNAGVTNFRGIYWEPERDTLIAIPLFVFMGIMLQRSKIAEDLLVTMAQLFGPVRGGLGISVVFVGALLAATTGIVGATVVAMGLISLPAMLRNNYAPTLATGTIAASGTLGQIIPPSIVLIILADQLASAADQAGSHRQELYRAATGELTLPSEFAVSATSAGEMFLGAFLPGLLLVVLYMLFIFTIALMRPHVAPAVTYDGAIDRRFLLRALVTLVPPLALIFLVLGSIIGGVATVNQAGAIGALGAMVMAGYRLREGHRLAFAPAALALLSLLAVAVVLSFYDVNIKRIATPEDATGATLAAIAVSALLIALAWSGWRTLKFEDTLRGVMVDTAKTSALVFIILIGAAMLTAAFRAFGGEEIVKDFLHGLPGGFWTQFIIVMAVIFILGFFLDFIEIAVVVVPVVAPILLADPSANITAVWLGVMVGLNIQTSFLTPPFGFALFYLRGVAPPSVRTTQIYRGVVPFIFLQLFALAVVGATPWLVNYLPNRVALLSQTAPPPQNPRLQYCLDEFVAGRFARDRGLIDRAIGAAQANAYQDLPAGLADDIQASFATARSTFAHLDAIAAAQRAVADAAPAYRPLHAEVRRIERDALRVAEEIEAQKTIIARSGPQGIYSAERGERAAREVERLEARHAALLATIPAEWDARQAAFRGLDEAEAAARRDYHRAADAAYAPAAEVVAMIEAEGELAALGTEVRALLAALRNLAPAAFVETVAALRGALGDAAGTDDIRSALGDARSAMRAAPPDPAAAEAALAAAIAALESELAWRGRARQSALPTLDAYLEATGDTIGLRSHTRLTREQALFVAGCSAHHRDISLHF